MNSLNHGMEDWPDNAQNRGQIIFSCSKSWVIPLYHGVLLLCVMVTYRTSMQIVADLLTAAEQSGQEGIKTTSLLTKANLSHSRLAKFIENLTGAGLINKIEFDGKHTFVLTPKGRQYLESYQKFSGIAESFGLEL